MSQIRRVQGTKHPNIVCKFCAHIKTWHTKEGPCRASFYTDGLVDCDCEAWDYGANVTPYGNDYDNDDRYRP